MDQARNQIGFLFPVPSPIEEVKNSFSIAITISINSILEEATSVRLSLEQLIEELKMYVCLREEKVHMLVARPETISDGAPKLVVMVLRCKKGFEIGDAVLK